MLIQFNSLNTVKIQSGQNNKIQNLPLTYNNIFSQVKIQSDENNAEKSKTYL